jgi:hypothetical protein
MKCQSGRVNCNDFVILLPVLVPRQKSIKETNNDLPTPLYVLLLSDCSGLSCFAKMVDMISTRPETSFQAAGIVLISKYFETCDVFEEPK